jgi:hypothetical protein
VIAEPPLLVGAVHPSVTEPVFAEVADMFTGTPGAPPGVEVAMLPAPAPAKVTARTRK